MIRTFIIFCLLFVFIDDSYAQGWLWASGGVGGNGEAYAPVADAFGNSYMVGSYGGADTFGTICTPDNPSSFNSIIIVKCGPLGQFLWVARTVQDCFADAIGIAADNSGDLYLFGVYTGPTFNIGSVALTNTSSLSYAYFLAKYNASGTVVWAINVGLPGSGSGGFESFSGAIAVKNNHVYITATYVDPVMTVGTFSLTNHDPTGLSRDFFIAKVDSNSNIEWVTTAGDSKDEWVTAITITQTEHLYVAGEFNSPSLAFGTSVLSFTGAPMSTFLTKYDSSGNVLWGTSPPGKTSAQILATDNSENAILGGAIPAGGTITFGSTALVNTPSAFTNRYGYIAKYNPSGVAQWAEKISGYDTWVGGIATDACNNIWMGVSIMVNAFSPRNDTLNGHALIPPPGFEEPISITGLDSMGNYFTSCMSETGGDDAFGVCADGIGNIYLGGDNYFGALYYTFGGSVIRDRNGGENIFLAKYRYNSDTDTTFVRIDTCYTDSLVLSATPGFNTYLWSDGGIGPLRNIHDTGTYWVYCTGACGKGLTIDTFKVTSGNKSTHYEHTDSTICRNAKMTLHAPPGYPQYLWSTGAVGNSIMIDSAGTYWVKAPGSCSAPNRSDTFKVILSKVDLSFSLGNDTTSCMPVSLHVPVHGVNYLWQDGSTDSTYYCTRSGTYSVTISELGCTFADTVQVSMPVIALQFRDTVVCKELIIDVPVRVNVPTGATVLWSTGSTQPDITITAEGRYWATITDGSCSSSDTLTVSSEFCNCELYLPNTFTPNNDGKNDFYGPVALPGCNIMNYYFAIYNRWGQQVFHTEDPNGRWDGKFKDVNAEVGVYMYYVKYSSGLSKKSHFTKGDVTLAR